MMRLDPKTNMQLCKSARHSRGVNQNQTKQTQVYKILDLLIFKLIDQNIRNLFH